MEMSTNSGDDNLSGIEHSPNTVDASEPMDVGDTFSNSDVILNNNGDNLQQLPEGNANESFMPARSNDQQLDDDLLSLPSCSKDPIPRRNRIELTHAIIRRRYERQRERRSDSNKRHMREDKKLPLQEIDVPKPGTPVSSQIIRKAGPFELGPLIGSSPVQSITQCLAKKEGTGKFYTIKILTLRDTVDSESQDDRQGKMLLHSEYSLLSLLQNQDGVVHHHGFFKV